MKNALRLGGIPANKYALKEQAESIEVDFEGLKTVYANEIRILRDELQVEDSAGQTRIHSKRSELRRFLRGVQLLICL